ncbi:replication initiator protein [Sigmofec virus UA08Rod_4687]|uniref:Replication initiator protein n=1 Tax=Sigmofec virus UA08Rod_4687 TaxID=2929407 RepID=A0A976N1Q0_9VIRU|nr:replication initiator protein [Sigmofec virus UA08Rod_4687]
MATQMTINCQHPNIVMHPYAKSYFVRFGAFCFDGKLDYSALQYSRNERSHKIGTYLKLFKTFWRLYGSDAGLHFDFDTLLRDFHFVDVSSGEVYPMFMIVPCCKCELCCYNKLNDISARCALETYTSKSRPLFITLTYDNEHLPSDGSVSLDDIQKFLKRLRMYLDRFTCQKNLLRYLYCSEYTPNNKRPHYHLLVWNVPYLPNGLSSRQQEFLERNCVGYPDNGLNTHPLSRLNRGSYGCLIGNNLNCDLGRINGYDVLKKLVWLCWKKGYIKVEVSRDAGSYVAKYIGKGSSVPKGCKPTFVRWSTRRGLGFAAYDLYFESVLRQNPSLTQISFCDPKVGKVSTVPIPKYYRTLLAPSLSVISKPFRTQLEWFHLVYCSIKYIRLSSNLVTNDVYDLVKTSHAHIIQKYDLFVDTCQLSVNPLDCECKSYLRGIISRCINVFVKSEEFEDLLDNYWTIYQFLSSFDLDSLHLSDILNYKVLNTMARKDYSVNHPRFLNDSLFKAKCFYEKVDRTTRANDPLVS